MNSFKELLSCFQCMLVLYRVCLVLHTKYSSIHFRIHPAISNSSHIINKHQWPSYIGSHTCLSDDVVYFGTWAIDSYYSYLNVTSGSHLELNQLYLHSWRYVSIVEFDNERTTTLRVLDFARCYEGFLTGFFKVFFFIISFYNIHFKSSICCGAHQCITSFWECTKLLIWLLPDFWYLFDTSALFYQPHE